MRSPTHVIGGISITGIAAAFAGENILATKTNIACVVLFSLLPDIDNPLSPLGKCFSPLSNFIISKYGHRTITHSLGALIVVCLCVAGLQKLFDATGVKWCHLSTVICGVAYFSHLFLDMMTFQGVPLMYPDRSEWHFPDNPKYQFKTGGNGEYVVCGALIGLSVFSAPLMEGGFWTVYNRSFGTPKTLYSEFIKSSDLLEATYKIQRGSAIDTGRGYVIDADNKDKFTLYRNDSVMSFDASQQIIKEVIPTHTGRKFYFETKTFVGIEADSLNRLLKDRIIIDIQADANEPFVYHDKGVPNKSLSAKLHFPNHLFFRSLDSLPPKDSLFQEVDFASMGLRNDLKRLDEEYKHRCAEFKRHADSLTIYSNWAATEKDFVTKERYQKRRDELRVEEKPQFDYVAQNDLNAKLQLSIARFAVDNQRRLFEREKAFVAVLRAKPKTTFVGVVKWIRLE
jgi:inner membrane protein